MASLSAVRNAVDAQLATLWAAIQAAQDEYYAAHDRYWQGKPTHAADLAYTAAKEGDVEPDRIDDHPTDQAESWRDLFPQWAAVKLRAALRIDTYSGPSGDGYVGTVRVKYDGTVYERSQNSGPETERTLAWHVVSEAEG